MGIFKKTGDLLLAQYDNIRWHLTPRFDPDADHYNPALSPYEKDLIKLGEKFSDLVNFYDYEPKEMLKLLDNMCYCAYCEDTDLNELFDRFFYAESSDFESCVGQIQDGKSIARFEKVSYERFKEDILPLFSDDDAPEYVEEAIKALYDNIELPTRATVGSAGYDFKLPIPIELGNKEVIKIPTGIRARIDSGWFLSCYPRSGLGFKYGMRLMNTVGIIDSDYYDSDNEGHIFAKFYFDNIPEGEKLSLNVGDAFMQGVLLPYGMTHSDKTSARRNGGFGSTDKQ